MSLRSPFALTALPTFLLRRAKTTVSPSLLKIATAAVVVAGLSACSGAEEYRGEFDDCTVVSEKSDAVLLVDRSPSGEVIGGWFAIAFGPDVFIGAELEKIDIDGETLKFEVEYEAGSDKIEVEVELEVEDDEFVGEIDLSIPTSDFNDNCEIKLERETF